MSDSGEQREPMRVRHGSRFSRKFFGLLGIKSARDRRADEEE